MPPRREEQVGLLGQAHAESLDAEDGVGVELDDFAETLDYVEPRPQHPWTLSWGRSPRPHAPARPRRFSSLLTATKRRRWTRQGLTLFLIYPFYVVFALVVLCGLFFPSYTNPPPRYVTLRKQVAQAGDRAGSANVLHRKVFIAAALYDVGGELVSGDWGRAVTSLINMLGPENVHLSIYENDADDRSKAALKTLESALTCNTSIVAEDAIDTSNIAHVLTRAGQRRLKRMVFLAEVRNRALLPLTDETSPASETRFDRLLYLNDIIFDPVDAANLLFSTNADEAGMPQYLAACATDFVNPFKFYDTFATRDMEGYSMGVPFYPWFSGAGKAISRKDVIAQKDAVRVKSCWGGMVAFEARWFQPQLRVVDKTADLKVRETTPAPLRFRAEREIYWDASECCLVHADLAALAAEANDSTGIFMNPYIRVAYSKTTLKRLSFTRRFERLYTPVHTIINWIARLPVANPRRLEQPGEEVVDRVWAWNAESQAAVDTNTVSRMQNGLYGSFEDTKRRALPGSFCGLPLLYYINENPRKGESRWGIDHPPKDGW